MDSEWFSFCLSHTDLCSSVDLPEVEIVSLLTEELPKYTLRADHVFEYEHDDWLHTPLLPPEAALELTQEQIDETLKYFCESTPFYLTIYCFAISVKSNHFKTLQKLGSDIYIYSAEAQLKKY